MHREAVGSEGKLILHRRWKLGQSFYLGGHEESVPFHVYELEDSQKRRRVLKVTVEIPGGYRLPEHSNLHVVYKVESQEPGDVRHLPAAIRLIKQDIARKNGLEELASLRPTERMLRHYLRRGAYFHNGTRAIHFGGEFGKRRQVSEAELNRILGITSKNRF